MPSAGWDARLVFFASLLLFIVLAGCATGDPALEKASAELREGRTALSPGQEASLIRAPHPGLLRFWDDFEERVAVGRSFVVSDPGEDNRYLRLSEKGQSYIPLIPPYPNERPGGGESRLRDFRLVFDLRLPETGEKTLFVAGRRKEGSEVSVTFALSADSLRLLEGVPGRERLVSVEERTAALQRGWREVELRLLGREAELLVDGETLLYSSGLEWLQRGGISLFCEGSVEIDDLRLYAMEGLQEPDGSALFVRELRDDFGGEELPPWWKREGNGAVKVGLPGGGVRLFGSERYETVSGLSTTSLLPVEGSARVEFFDPPERTYFGVGIAKPTVADALIIGVQERFVTLVQYTGGAGKRLVRRRLPPAAWSSAGRQELELIVAEGVIQGRLNGIPVLSYRDRPEVFRGFLFVGYLGHYSRSEGRTIRSVEMSSGLPSGIDPSTYPSGVEVGSTEEEALPSFDKAPALFADFDHSGAPHFEVGANERSDARAEVVVDEASGEGYLSLDFTMKEGSGLHALVGFGLDKDLSDYGGIAFRARGEEISRAHVSMNEIAVGVVGDRIDAFFPVGPEWREYRLPFTPEYFAPNGDHLLRGADGIFDFAHTGWMLFEVYGYEGRGALHIDEIRFLPGGAKRQFTDRITVDNFEPDDRRTPFGLETHTDIHGEAVAEYGVTSGRGARGSDGFAAWRVDKGARDHVRLEFRGGIPAAEYKGVGLAARGSGVTTAVVSLHELEEASADLSGLWESHSCTIPLSQEWVEWRFPFLPGALRPSRYIPLTDGALGGWFVEGLSFSFPQESQGQGMELHLDEFFLFETGSERSARVGLFGAYGKSGDDRRISGVIDSVLLLNLDRLQGYELRGGLQAESRESAFNVASEKELDFFVRPVYHIDGDTLSLSLELCNVPAGTVSKVIEEETVVGLDVFYDLDLLSTEVINNLADTNLAFEDHLTRTEKGGSTVWLDSLERIEPYWLEFDGVEAQVADGLRLSQVLTAPESDGAGGRANGFLFEAPMLLSDAYLSGLEAISVEITEGAAVLWNYRGRDALNLLELADGEVRVGINGTDSVFGLPTGAATEQWRRLSLEVVDSGYRVLLDNQALGTANGYDVPYGRLGLAVAEGVPGFRNLQVRFTE
ncbi:MAG: hypothetical protein ACLFNP_10640 [Spirochaetaceae bacterium]